MNSRTISAGKRGRQKPRTRFQRLWLEAEEKARKNQVLEKELNALVTRLDKEVLKAERELGEVTRQFVYRQLKFARSKSLLKWQREELNDWMVENLSHLFDMNLLDEPLRDEIARLRAWELGIELDPDSELSPAEQLDQYLTTDDDDWCGTSETNTARNKISNGDLFDDADLDDTHDSTFDINAFDEEEQQAEDELEELLRMMRDQFSDYQERSAQVDSGINGRQGKSVDGQVFKRLFRQTAAALHPDREPDDVRRQEKHSLMSQLLKARKERDLITLVMLHERHATADSALSSDDQEALEEVLVDYLGDQQGRFEEIIQQSPMHHLAYTRFYHERPATVTRRINSHVRKIAEKRQSLIEFMAEVKTLKSFKEVLAARNEARRLSDFWF